MINVLRLVLIFVVFCSVYFLYEIGKISWGIFFSSQHIGVAFCMNAGFFVACLICIKLSYSLAFPLSAKKRLKISRQNSEIEAIEACFVLVESLSSGLADVYNEKKMQENMQFLRNSRKSILVGKEQGRNAISVCSFKKAIAESKASFDAAQSMMNSLEKGIEENNYISKRQRRSFLRSIANYRKKFSASREILEKYLAIKV